MLRQFDKFIQLLVSPRTAWVPALTPLQQSILLEIWKIQTKY